MPQLLASENRCLALRTFRCRKRRKLSPAYFWQSFASVTSMTLNRPSG